MASLEGDEIHHIKYVSMLTVSAQAIVSYLLAQRELRLKFSKMGLAAEATPA
jgi:hypothetical protein